MISLSILINYKKSDNLILITINWFKKMVYYNLANIIINTLSFAKTTI